MFQALVRMFVSWRFATFLVFGGLAALVNLLVGRALYTLPGPAAFLPFWVAVLIGAASGLLVNFGLNYAFNFRYRGRSALAQLRTFVVVALGGVGLTALLASVLLELAYWAGLTEGLTLFGWHLSTPFLSHAGATALVTFYSFAGHSVLSFNAGLRAFVTRMPGLLPSLRRAA
jgi:putative flippase GtrA